MTNCLKKMDYEPGPKEVLKEIGREAGEFSLSLARGIVTTLILPFATFFKKVF